MIAEKKHYRDFTTPGKKLFEEGVRLLQTEDNDYCSVPEAVLPYAKIYLKALHKRYCKVKMKIVFAGLKQMFVQRPTHGYGNT